MTNYQIGDLLLVDFPLTASGPGKPRPALVILDSGDADVLLARVTTRSHGSPFDVPIAAWQQAGLLAPSFVRLHKLATRETSGPQASWLARCRRPPIRRLGATAHWCRVVKNLDRGVDVGEASDDYRIRVG